MKAAEIADELAVVLKADVVFRYSKLEAVGLMLFRLLDAISCLIILSACLTIRKSRAVKLICC